jgi:hypothetical protein
MLAMESEESRTVRQTSDRQTGRRMRTVFVKVVGRMWRGELSPAIPHLVYAARVGVGVRRRRGGGEGEREEARRDKCASAIRGKK